MKYSNVPATFFTQRPTQREKLLWIQKVNLTLAVSVPFFLSESGAEFKSGKRQIKKLNAKSEF